MDRDTALAMVRHELAGHPGATHVRLETHGSMSGRTRVEVMTRLAKSQKGVRQEQWVRFAGETDPVTGHPFDGAYTPDEWIEAFTVLDPTIELGRGCAQHTGFDVDAEGNLSRRHGAKRR